MRRKLLAVLLLGRSSVDTTEIYTHLVLDHPRGAVHHRRALMCLLGLWR